MLDFGELIFGIAKGGVQPMIVLMTLGFMFDYFRIFLFKD